MGHFGRGQANKQGEYEFCRENEMLQTLRIKFPNDVTPMNLEGLFENGNNPDSSKIK